MRIHNLVEEHVHEAYEGLRSHFPSFCGCDVCRADVLVYTLNRLPARYVASREGTVLTEINLDRQQVRTQLDVVLMEAFRRVAVAPRCKLAKPRAL
jgi:competence protein ComFB